MERFFVLFFDENSHLVSWDFDTYEQAKQVAEHLAIDGMHSQVRIEGPRDYLEEVLA